MDNAPGKLRVAEKEIGALFLHSGKTKTLVTILGSGTCVPSLKRSSAAVHVKTGTSHILLDMGAGTIRRLLEAGHSIFDITHILITHFHPDHTGELVSFLFSNKYPDCSLRDPPLVLIGGPGFLRFFEKLVSVYGAWIQLPPEKVRLMELNPKESGGPEESRRLEESNVPEESGRIDFKDFSLFSAPVSHSPESIAYRIQTKAGETVVCSGDTDVCKSLKDLATDADLLICESALPDALKTAGHLTPSLAGRLAADARVKKLVLTHFYPECDDADMAGECRRVYNGPVILARDLMELEL
jgi:ribonuclease BN (tRNA processing enzyme)